MQASVLEKSNNTHAYYVSIKCKYTMNLILKSTFCSGTCHLPKHNTMMAIVP